MQTTNASVDTPRATRREWFCPVWIGSEAIFTTVTNLNRAEPYV
jgi:hypothetical protein